MMLTDQLRQLAVALGVLSVLGSPVLSPLKAEEGKALTPRQQAYLLWQQGYLLHLGGAFEQAVLAFRKSLEIHPTAEAHTFLGWSLSQLGRLDEAIAECKRAIELDPEYGNPYNDIGVYLIELGRPDEAIPWLTKAIGATRYCCYEFPHFNLGRILLMKGRIEEAKRSFERALSHNPDYLPARKALELLREVEREVT
jgi:tetratricopeptide (TPR) repeat protein